jgi:hypothetical protein
MAKGQESLQRRRSIRWTKTLVRAFSVLIAVLFFLGLGFRGEPVAGLLVVAGAIAVAVTPEGALARREERLIWILVVVAGLLGGGLCIWQALVYSPSPDVGFATFSGIATLSLAIGFARLL